MPAFKPKSGSSVKSADSTNPATAAASMTIGAARTAPMSPPSGVNVCGALLTLRKTASGNNVNSKHEAPTANGRQPRVPVNSSRAGPPVIPIEKTVP